MKKLLTFTSFIGLVGLLAILLGFVPCIQAITTYNHVPFNLFTATFGGSIEIADVGSGTAVQQSITYNILPCGGLIVGFIFAVIGFVASVISFKTKLANLLAGGLFITSGILTLCSVALVTNASSYGTLPQPNFEILPGAIAIGVLLIVAGTLSLIYFLTTVFKPKKQETY